MNCPICSKEVEDVKVCRCDKPYTAKQVFEGLEAWGAIQAIKETICENDQWVHFRFLHDSSERLVEMKPFDLEKIEIIKGYHAAHPEPCEHKGCDKVGNPGYMEMYDEEPMGWYCEEHAREGGFCPGCMLFGAGRDDFDFSRTGLCGPCSEALEAETAWDEDCGDDDWGWDGEDY